MIDYDNIYLKRSRRKTVGMEILPDGKVLVRAPFFVPEEEIRKDYEIAKDSFYNEAYKRNITPIMLKREIGAKYGLSPINSKSLNVGLKIYKR